MVSLEMGTADLARRENQLETGVSARVQRDFTRMNDAQFKAIIDATEVGKWHGSAVYLRRQPAATPSQVGHVIKAVKRQAAKDWTGSNRRELKAVVVDHVHLMRPDERRLQGESAWASISGRLKELAIEHGVAMICPAQLNRETEAGGKHREPRVSDIRGSGAFEQDADTIVLIDREEGQNEGTIIIGKGRYSGASRIDVAWESRRTKYTSIDGEESPQEEQRTLEKDGVPF